MKILAVESSAKAASCALVDEENLIAEYFINNKKTHSQTLLPMIADMLKMIEFDIKDIDAIACANGPGSFTGLRIGAATVRGLAYSLEKPIIPVSTLDAMACAFISDSYIIPMIDARCMQVFTGIYDGGDSKSFIPKEIVEKQVCKLDELTAYINDKCIDKEVILCGDGVANNIDYIIGNVSENIKIKLAPFNLSLQRASCVGKIAVDYLKNGNIKDIPEFDIDYFRKSRAEQERERNANNKA